MAFLGNDITMFKENQKNEPTKQCERKAGAENVEAVPSLAADADIDVVDDSMPSTSTASTSAAIRPLPAHRDTVMAEIYGRAPPQPRVNPLATRETAVVTGSPMEQKKIPPPPRETTVVPGATVAGTKQIYAETPLPTRETATVTGSAVEQKKNPLPMRSFAVVVQKEQQQPHERLPQPRIETAPHRALDEDQVMVANEQSNGVMSDIEDEEPREDFEDVGGLQILADAAMARRAAEKRDSVSAAEGVLASLAPAAAASVQPTTTIITQVTPDAFSAVNQDPLGTVSSSAVPAAAEVEPTTDATADSLSDEVNDVIRVETPEEAAVAAAMARLAADATAESLSDEDDDIIVLETPEDAAAGSAPTSAAVAARTAVFWRRLATRDAQYEPQTTHEFCIKFQDLVYGEYDVEKLQELLRRLRTIDFSLPDEQSSESSGVDASNRRADDEDGAEGEPSSSSQPAHKKIKQEEDGQVPKQTAKDEPSSSLQLALKRNIKTEDGQAPNEAVKQSDVSLPQSTIDGKEKVDTPLTRAATRASPPLATRTRGRAVKTPDAIPKVKKEQAVPVDPTIVKRPRGRTPAKQQAASTGPDGSTIVKKPRGRTPAKREDASAGPDGSTIVKKPRGRTPAKRESAPTGADGSTIVKRPRGRTPAKKEAASTGPDGSTIVKRPRGRTPAKRETAPAGPDGSTIVKRPRGRTPAKRETGPTGPDSSTIVKKPRGRTPAKRETAPTGPDGSTIVKKPRGRPPMKREDASAGPTIVKRPRGRPPRNPEIIANRAAITSNNEEEEEDRPSTSKADRSAVPRRRHSPSGHK